MSTEIYKALVKARKEMGPLLKNAKNPHFKSNYANLGGVLDTIEDALSNNGLMVVQAVNEATGDSNTPTLTTELIHESGETKSYGSYPLYSQNQTDPQKFGSALTYGRRYSLMALFGLAAEDDDGNAAAGRDGARTGTTAAKAPAAKQGEGQPTLPQRKKAQALLKEVRGAMDPAAGNKITQELFKTDFDKLSLYQIGKLIETLESEKVATAGAF